MIVCTRATFHTVQSSPVLCLRRRDTGEPRRGFQKSLASIMIKAVCPGPTAGTLDTLVKVHGHGTRIDKSWSKGWQRGLGGQKWNPNGPNRCPGNPLNKRCSSVTIWLLCNKQADRQTPKLGSQRESELPRTPGCAVSSETPIHDTWQQPWKS